MTRHHIDKHFADWKHLGFRRYDEEDSRRYFHVEGKMEQHPPLYIVQIDSLYKVAGTYDLILLDEVEYTLQHLIEFTDNKVLVFQELTSRLREAQWVLALDALLSDATINLLRSCGREPYIYVNNYEKHQDKEIWIVKKRKEFNQIIIDALDKGLRVAIPVNSKVYAKTLDALLRERFPNLSIGLFSAETLSEMRSTGEIKGDPIDGWSRYDVVIYTPTITAGSSFTTEHFDIICGYFSSGSACAEMACQQLFRVRNVKAGKIYLLVTNRGGAFLETRTIAGVKERIKNEYLRIHCGSDTNLMYFRVLMILLTYNQRFCQVNLETPACDLYAHILLRVNESKRDYLHRLLICLKRQGIRFGGVIADNEEISSDLDREFTELQEETSFQVFEEIANSPNLSWQETKMMSTQRDLTILERRSLQKSQFQSIYRLDPETGLTGTQVQKYFKLVRQHRNLERILPIIKIEDANQKWIDFDNLVNVHQPRLIDGPQPHIFSLAGSTPERTSLQQKLAYSILTHLGFDGPFDKKEIHPNFRLAVSYIMGSGAKSIFHVTYKGLGDPDKELDKSQVMRWINDRLRSVWGICVKTKNRKPGAK